MNNKKTPKKLTFENSCPTKAIIKKFYSSTEPKACVICNKQPKPGRKCLYNLRTHIKTSHKMEYFNFIKDYIESVDIQVREFEKKSSLDVYTDNIQFFSMAMSMSMVPINIIEDAGIKYIINTINPKVVIPSRKSVTNFLKQYSMELKERIKKELNQSTCYSFSIDLWTLKSSNYASLLVKYRRSNTLVTRTISISHIQNQKVTTIKQFIEEQFRFYCIEVEKIVSFTTDNCSAMLKSISDLKESMNPDYSDFELFSDMDPKSIDELNSGSHFSIQTYCNTEFDKVFIGLGCQIHTLQLCIKDAVKQNNYFIQLFDKVHKILIKLRTSKYRENFKGIPYENPTRWDFYFELLNYFNKNFDEIKKILLNNSSTINVDLEVIHDIEAVREYSSILYAFQLLTKDIENSNFFCGTYFYKLISLKNKLQSIIKGGSSRVSGVLSFTGDLCTSINTRIFNDEKSTNFLKNLSLFFLPEYYFSCECTERVIMDKIVLEYSQANITEIPVIKKPESKKQSVVEIMNDSNKYADFVTHEDSIEEEILKYTGAMSFNQTPIEFWHGNRFQFPILYRVFLRLESVFVGNGEVERIFSRMKLLSHWHKGRIKPQTIEARILTNEEYKLNK